MMKRTIFMTGFPGFIGARLVKKLATPDTRFLFLVQKAFAEKAITEIRRIARDLKLPQINFIIINGDITETDLGMTEADLKVVLERTTDVFHLAAVYDLGVDKEVGYLVNVEGTKNVNSVVERIENLARYNYVSTCYVAGKRNDRIGENELEHDAGFRNFYEETKYFAELEAEKLKEKVPLTIYRPSVVCGDSETGETAKYDGIYYVIRFLLKFPEVFRLVNVGNDDVRLNLVPVDFVVDGMVSLCTDERAVGKTVALADPNPMTTKQICDAIAEAITNKKSVITPPSNVLETFLSSPFSPPITGMPSIGAPYFFVPQSYDTSVAEELLEPYGVRCPSFDEYVKTLVKFVENNPKL